MFSTDHDPSIEHEPHLSRGPHKADPSVWKAEQALAKERRRERLDDVVEYSVWDEPALSGELAGADNGTRRTYARWLDWRMATTSRARTWIVALVAVLAAGPWAVLGSLISGGAAGVWGLVAVAIVGPITEEMMKISVALWIVERRPYLFRLPLQIVLGTLASGLVFATIENLIYLHIYFPHASPALATFRWTVCVALHGTCSTIAGVGLTRMWSHTVAHGTRPEIARAARWIIAAMVLHGLYNTTVTIIKLGGWGQF